MLKYNAEATITEEGELHLEHLPFHTGEKVNVIVYSASDSEERDRKSEYEMFMAGYDEADFVYDKL
jgi:hypothetical protein